VIAAVGTALVVYLGLVAIDSTGGGETTTTSSSSTTSSSTTSTTAPETTTSTEPETTTSTEPETTTTTQPETIQVPTTPVNAVLGLDPPPYGDVSVADPGSVVGDVYQFEGFYVFLYRGLDLEVLGSRCLGNSLQSADSGEFENVSNFPTPSATLGTDLDPCVGATEEQLAAPPAGSRVCGGLAYYVSEIPVEAAGQLFISVELWAGNTPEEISGITGFVEANPGQTPEFVPDQTAYELPPSDFDNLTTVTCPLTTDG
jgi:hypothetical protein